MVVVKNLTDNLLVCFDYRAYLYDITSKQEKKIEIPAYIEDPNSKEDPNLKEAKNISGVAISRTQDYFAIVKYKQVVIYRKNLEIVKNYTLKRAANSITFTKDNDVLVADKTGDVYLYSIGDGETRFVLGHLSMLLDLTVSRDGKFLLTSDRDEKIRVSRFPNTYNIQSFCLGHTECITRIVVLDERRMLSCSGDGSIIVWEFLTGKVLYRVNTNANLKVKGLIDDFCKRMNENKCEATCLPVIDMQTFEKDGSYYIVAEIYNSNTLQVYKVAIDSNNGEVNVEFLQDLSVDSRVKSFSLTEKLFIFCDAGVKMFSFGNGRFLEESCKDLNKFYLECKDEDKSEDFDIATLYKRKFHNVEEYLEKKRQRIEKKK